MSYDVRYAVIGSIFLICAGCGSTDIYKNLLIFEVSLIGHQIIGRSTIETLDDYIFGSGQ